MTKSKTDTVRVTSPFAFSGNRYYAGDVCEGEAAKFALSQNKGKPYDDKKQAAPSNKAASAKKTKAG